MGPAGTHNLLHVPGSITVESSRQVLARRVEWARTASARAGGLRGRASLERDEALVLEPAKQVHSFGMRFPIDVVFCDRDWIVRHVIEHMRPRRVSRVVPKARYAIEMRAGVLRGGVRVGDRLRVESSAQ